MLPSSTPCCYLGKDGKRLRTFEDGPQVAFGNTSDLLGLPAVPSIVIIHPSSKYHLAATLCASA